MIRPFITGAKGFIGSYLLRGLNGRGIEARLHDSSMGDIATAALNLNGCTHVVHLAGKAFVPDSWSEPGEYYRVNLQGTLNVLEHCRRFGLPLTLVSSYVYGIPQELPIRESHPLSFLNPYAHSKILAEEAAKAYADFFGVRVVAVRPFNIYGPGQDRRYLIPLLVRQAVDSSVEHFEVADAKPRRDYLHVEDLVELLCRTLVVDACGPVNAGSGHSHSISEIVDILNSGLPSPKKLRSRQEPRPREVENVVADISVAEQVWGWTPRIRLADGLNEMLRKELATV